MYLFTSQDIKDHSTNNTRLNSHQKIRMPHSKCSKERINIYDKIRGSLISKDSIKCIWKRKEKQGICIISSTTHDC